MPVGPAGHSRAVCIRTLMARGALQRRNALTLRPTDDVRKMAMPVIALLRIIGGRMTIYAAWRCQNRVDLLPGGKALGLGRARFYVCWLPPTGARSR
jgi:hypothetical protein